MANYADITVKIIKGEVPSTQDGSQTPSVAKQIKAYIESLDIATQPIISISTSGGQYDWTVTIVSGLNPYYATD
jgi:hypothetical protein